MANQHPGLMKVGQVWHYYLKVNGQRAHGSTRARDLGTAKKVMDARRKELIQGQLILPRKPPTLRELYKEWLMAHELVFSQKHLTTVHCIFRRWIEPMLGAKRVDQVGNQDALNLRSAILNDGLSGRYANNALQTLKLLLNFGIKQGVLRILPYRVQPIRLQERPRPVVPATRVREFLDAVQGAAKNPHVSGVIWTMLALGLREGEVLGMRWEWLNLDQQTYTVGKAKGKEARVLPVPEWLLERLRALVSCGSSEWIFPAKDDSPHRSQFCKKTLRRVCGSLGLGNLTGHRLRATFATLHAQAGTPITEIQGMLGHKCITTTMIYIETSLEAKRRAQDHLSERLGLA